MSGHGRVRRGKAPLRPYWRIEPPRPTVLVPNPAPTPAAAGKPKGTHASPRPHDRRGHPRHPWGGVVWVKPLQWRDEERPKPAAVTVDDQLAELWAAGATLSDIGLKLGGSRSFIAGRIARARARGDLRFALRPPTPKKERAPKPLIVKPAVVKPVGTAAFVERKGKPLVALKPGQCHYPLNDPERGGEFLFCAEPIAKSGANYCSRHAKVALRTQHPTVPRGGFMGLHGAPCPQEADCLGYNRRRSHFEHLVDRHRPIQKSGAGRVKRRQPPKLDRDS
jgi:hypothetical protein